MNKREEEIFFVDVFKLRIVLILSIDISLASPSTNSFVLTPLFGNTENSFSTPLNEE